MFAVVYVRAEIIGKLPSGQKRVHLLANGADGISFYTDNKSIVYDEALYLQQIKHYARSADSL